MRYELRGNCHRDSSILQEHFAVAKALFANIVQLEVDQAHNVQELAARSAYLLHDMGSAPVISLSPPDLLAAEAKLLARGRADRKVPATATSSVPCFDCMQVKRTPRACGQQCHATDLLRVQAASLPGAPSPQTADLPGLDVALSRAVRYLDDMQAAVAEALHTEKARLPTCTMPRCLTGSRRTDPVQFIVYDSRSGTEVWVEEHLSQAQCGLHLSWLQTMLPFLLKSREHACKP